MLEKTYRVLEGKKGLDVYMLMFGPVTCSCPRKKVTRSSGTFLQVMTPYYIQVLLYAEHLP